MPMTKLTSNIHFIELALSDGATFDALVPGTFTDMLGREVTISPSDLSKIVENTIEAIGAAVTATGEIVGLPIDAKDHDKGDGAGWIVGAELSGGIVRLQPKWTMVGRDLIAGGIRRFFSATVDLKNKIILGGTLTNWPALRNKKGVMQLRPIELSANLCEIVQDDDSPEVMEMAKNKTATPNEPVEKEVSGGGIDLAALRNEIKSDILAEFQKSADGDDAADRMKDSLKIEAFADVADLSGARDALLGQMQTALRAEYTRMQANAGQMLAGMMAEIKRDQHVAEFAALVVGGNEKRPVGFPVGQEEVETFLLSLSDVQRTAAESIFGRIHEQGLVEFGAIGHGKHSKAKLPVPEFARESLQATIDAGNSATAFFTAAGLGDADGYDLSGYVSEE